MPITDLAQMGKPTLAQPSGFPVASADTQATKIVPLTNLVINGNLSNGVNGSTGTNGTLTADSTKAKVGSNSGKMVVTTGGDNFILVTGGTTTLGFTPTVFPVTAGHIFSLSAFFLTDGVAYGSIRAIAFNSSGGVINDNQFTGINPTSWTQQSVMYTIPANATCLMIRIETPWLCRYR